MDVGAASGLARQAALDTPAAARERDIDAAASGFETLMLQRLLKDARSARIGDAPSNAQSNYEAMYDERIAGLIAEGGSLGLADALRRSLGATGEVTIEQPPAQLPLRQQGPALGLDARSLATLRSLMDASDGGDIAAQPAGAASALPGADALPGGDANAMLASLAAPEALASAADEPSRRRAFVELLHPHARRSAERLGTTPDVVLAVAAHESGWGRQPITDAHGRSANNLFGIKSHGHDGPSVRQRTTEYLDGIAQTVDAEFRRYEHPGASVADFADFLLENPRYRDALSQADRPEEFLRGLQAAGYATDPRYADKAIRVMDEVRRYLADGGEL